MKTTRKITVAILVVAIMLLASCGGKKKAAGGQESASDALSALSSGTVAEVEQKAAPEKENATGKYGEPDDLSKKVDLKFNLSYGNRSRTMTYNQNSPLTLSNGDVVTAGMLKPMWQRVSEINNSTFKDVAIQDAKPSDMIKTESTNGFTGATVYGGNGIATHFMNYGVQDKFVNFNDLIDGGYMPNFKAYLEANPAIRTAITAYDGGIYYIPYIAEIGNAAREFCVRENWITDILDNKDARYDTDSFETYYEPFYVGENARFGENGGSVTPKAGVTITKKTPENIIQIQNELPVKNGETLAKALIEYINRNYDYEKPSELYAGNKAAYDIDEFIALMRAVKANPRYLTDGKVDEVWAFFTRKSKYREDLLRFSTYFGGVRVHGADSYSARFEFDENGDIVYTYSQEDTYDCLKRFSQMNAEGLIYRDCFDISNRGNFRTVLYGSDAGENPAYGFLTFDWIASTTSESLNKDIRVILPPVAEVNGVWQYYIDNTRAIKPDGWTISAASSDEQIKRAATVMDFFFTEDGQIYQNYGLIEDVNLEDLYVGPGGTKWPKFNAWTIDSAKQFAKGDVSCFLRDWVGSLMPIGFQKQIGFEYQNTSDVGFDGWDLIVNSTVSFPNYSGEGKAGINSNYYKMTPSAYSFTEKQQEILNSGSSLGADDEVEYLFNIIKYDTAGNAPSGVTIPQNYDEYLKYFQDRGLDTYQKMYQTAYRTMQMTNN